MKVLCVIDSLGSGGAQRLFVNVVNGLSQRHDVCVFLYNPGPDFFKADLSPGVELHHVARRAGRKGFQANVLWQLIPAVRKSDVVVSFLPTANVYCAIAASFSPRTKHISCEMSVVNETEGRLRRGLANLANRHSDHVICNSVTQAEYVAKRPRMAGKVSAVFNGCAELSYVPRDFTEEHVPGFLVVARVAYPKNGVRLLEAMEVFRQRNGYVPKVSWAGRDDLGALAQQMKADMVAFLESHREVGANFTWLGEISDVQSLYAQSDALLSVSTHEGMPVVICEAMFAGCPIIASIVSDNAAILGDGARGFLCDPLSPEDICLAMEHRLNTSPDELQQMVESARSYATQNFTIDNMVAGYHRIVADLGERA